MSKIPFISVFLRSFFLQAAWNYPRLQGLGFLYALLPAARRLFPETDQRIAFLRRHSCFFNAQPYCASLAIGAVLRQEADASEVPGADSALAARETISCKEGLCGPLGLIGDHIFWQLLKPMAAALGMAAVLLTGGHSPAAALAGVFVLLITFNPLHLWMRWWGLKTGFERASQLSAFLAGSPLPVLKRRLSTIAPYLALFLTVVAFTFSRQSGGASSGFTFALGFAIMLFNLKRRLPLHWSLITVCAVCLLSALFITS